jgi:hypothetical protein
MTRDLLCRELAPAGRETPLMHLMRVDAPLRHRKFDQFAEYGHHLRGPLATTRQRMVILGVAIGLVALLPLPVAMVNGDWSTVLTCLAVLALCTWGVWWVRARTRQANAWKVPVAFGVDHLHEAHRLYRELSPQARDYGLLLVEALYEQATTRPASSQARDEQDRHMAEQVQALHTLVQTEERIRASGKDTNRLQNTRIWLKALTHVEQALSADT